ncbi:hypothetical protein SJI19_23350 [Acerihabitans sp. TG2]|uniref:hypothetical protein n=1 Tax=Acerihabitans sp. TG2 TaxID=3096008 RepID=UPI002B2261DC|nr:hypothetical protein [Acerihabitans sp. TG2]MEA9393431.1 hypothetical protein [Acerihabitans sp. TG2]
MKKITLRRRKNATLSMNFTHRYWLWAIFLAYGVFFSISLWIRSGFPVYAIADSYFDDLLFQKLARYLLRNDWLGPYNNVTLAKGMFYPAFIAVTSIIGLPLKIAEHILYLFGSIFVSCYVCRITKNRLLGLIIFAFLAFNPVLWTESLARVIREGIYISLSMILVILIIATLFPTEKNLFSRLQLFKSLLIGILGGFYWLTREEGIWLVPTVILILAFYIIQQSKKHGFICTFSKLFLKEVAVAVVAFCVVVGSVRFENWRHYHLFETTEFHTSSFLKAYGALARIKHDFPQRYVVFPKDARERAYSVSSSARELQPYLDGALGNGWKLSGRAQIPDASEIASGWFMWAFRDAVAAAGHYSSGEDAMNFYDRLANEINMACDEKKIECLPYRSTLAPVFQLGYITDTLFASKKILPFFLTLNDLSRKKPFDIPPSTGTVSQLNSISDLVGPINMPEIYTQRITGWIAANNQLPNLSFVGQSKNTIIHIDYSDAPDVTKQNPGFQALRFEASIESHEPINIKIKLSQSTVSSLVDIKNGPLLNTNTMKLFVDDNHFSLKTPLLTARMHTQHHIAKNIGMVYRTLMPYLFSLSMITFLFSLVQFLRTWQSSPLFVLCSACLTAVLSRITLLAYLDVTSIPSINILYISPATPFMIIFSITGSYLFFKKIKRLFCKESISGQR